MLLSPQPFVRTRDEFLFVFVIDVVLFRKH